MSQWLLAGIGAGHSRVVARCATGVRNLQALACTHATRVGTRGAQVVDSAAAEHLRNDLRCPDRCHGSRLQSIQAEVNWGVRLDVRRQVGHLFEDVCNRLLKKLLAEDFLHAG